MEKNISKKPVMLQVPNLPLVPEVLVRVEEVCQDAELTAMLHELLRHFDGDGIILELQVRDGRVEALHKPSCVQIVVRNYDAIVPDDSSNEQWLRDHDGCEYVQQEIW